MGRSRYGTEETFGMHPQDFYALCSPFTGYEEAMWIANIYYRINS